MFSSSFIKPSLQDACKVDVRYAAIHCTHFSLKLVTMNIPINFKICNSANYVLSAKIVQNWHGEKPCESALGMKAVHARINNYCINPFCIFGLSGGEMMQILGRYSCFTRLLSKQIDAILTPLDAVILSLE